MRRRGLLALGFVVLVAAWMGPLPELARQAFSAHMMLHMAVVAVAAPLLALGVAGGRFDPVPRAPALFAIIPASLIELVAVWAWHAPALHHAARHRPGAMVAEQATFLLAGLLLWLSVLGGDARRERARRALGVVGLLLTSMHMTLLGALLALTPRPLYHSSGSPPLELTPLALTPLEDQHLGGAIMLAVGGASYLLGGVLLMVGLVPGTARGREHARCEDA